MPTPSDAPGASFPDDPQRQEGVVGGADAVEKTSYVVGRGTEPEAQRARGQAAPVAPAGGSGIRVMLAVLALVILGGLVYALALR